MFTIQYVKNLKWENAEHTAFCCVVKYEEFNEEHPTGVYANDFYSHIQTIWAKGIAGEYGVIEEYVPPPVSIPVIDITPTTPITTVTVTNAT